MADGDLVVDAVRLGRKDRRLDREIADRRLAVINGKVCGNGDSRGAKRIFGGEADCVVARIK